MGSWLETYLNTAVSHSGDAVTGLAETTTTSATDTNDLTDTTDMTETNDLADSSSRTTGVAVIEDEGAHVTFKIKIRGGLTAGTSFAPICP